MRKLGYKIELRTERMYNEGFIIVTIIGEQIKVEGVLTEDYITSEENGDIITIIIHEYDVDIMGFNYELKFSINREQFQLPYEFYGEFEKVLSQNPGKNFYLDGVHPTAEGHQIMADIVLSALQGF